MVSDITDLWNIPFRDNLDREIEIEEILFEGKHYLKELNKDNSRSDHELFNLIEDKKERNKKLQQMYNKTIED